ncbi:MAG: phosphoribosylamine--glycine ligase [Rectinema sp.]
MKILVVGSGGREHALAWKLASSPSRPEILCAPGNAGTSSLGRNVPVQSDDPKTLADIAFAEDVDLVVVGPELPLSLGLSDLVAERSTREGKHILCFGPSRSAARIETSKVFAKEFMVRHGIPTARFAIFGDPEKACAFVRNAPWPFVIKASGLASGKGVFLPDTAEEAERILRSLLSGSALGEAGTEVVIEERLSGPEVSLMAFCDGSHIATMPPARDHKRLSDGDSGPNTGGMGAVVPAPGCGSALAARLSEQFLERAAKGLSSEGSPFVGVLYAGLILTSDGPKALEYNCRFGDPEAQAILPLFEGDFAQTLAACAEGKLSEAEFGWSNGACASVVLASAGYPGSSESGIALRDMNRPSEKSMVFHGATKLLGGQVVSRGGRTLCAVGLGDTLPDALDAAYATAARIDFPGALYRRDIGHSFFETPDGGGTAGSDGTTRTDGSAYAAAGVDIDSGERAVELMSAAVKATYDKRVLAGIGSFGGLYDASFLKNMESPVLVASTDGVGTKVRLAARTKGFRNIGMDIVNHCIDDILVQGARPLFFLDYFATSRLVPAETAQIVAGMAESCRASGCALIGGETAEMPGVYGPGEFDVAGTIVGVVERGRVLPRTDMAAGDILVGLRSDSPHTNGFSLIRKVFEGVDLGEIYPGTEAPLGELLLKPHRSYLTVLGPVLDREPGLVKALAHITGGGFIGNIPRILPPGLDAILRRESWIVPPLYRAIAEKGKVSETEMYRVFNMGIGMVAVMAPGALERFRELAGENCPVIGALAAGTGRARFA